METLDQTVRNISWACMTTQRKAVSDSRKAFPCSEVDISAADGSVMGFSFQDFIPGPHDAHLLLHVHHWGTYQRVWRGAIFEDASVGSVSQRQQQKRRKCPLEKHLCSCGLHLLRKGKIKTSISSADPGVRTAQSTFSVRKKTRPRVQ